MSLTLDSSTRAPLHRGAFFISRGLDPVALTTGHPGGRNCYFRSGTFPVAQRAARSPRKMACRFKAIDARIISVEAAYESWYEKR